MKIAKQRNFCKKRAMWRALVRAPWTLFPCTFEPLDFLRGLRALGDIPKKERA